MSSELAVEIHGGRWKRYPAYRDSGVEWLGEVPDGWIITVLKRVCKNITDGSHFSPEIQYVGIPYVTVQDIKGDYIDFDNCKRISEKDYISLKKNGCQPNRGDVLLTKDGTIGKAIVIKENRDFVILSSLGMITPNKLRILSEYMRYYLISGINIDQMFSFIRGSALTRLTIKLIDDLIMVIPPPSEQKAIVTYIEDKTGRIDTLIEKKERQVELLQEKRAALISHVVTKGLNPDVKMKDSGVEWLGELPEMWNIIKFRRVCRLQQGLQIAQANRFGEDGFNRFEYITIKSIHAAETSNSKEYIESPPRSVICTTDDVLLARTGATGEVITGQNGVFHNNFFKIIYNRKIVDKNYLIYYLSNTQIKKHFILLAGTTTIPDLNHGEFLSTPFIFPDINEQQNIVSYLNNETGNLDTLIDKIKESTSKLREYRTALISAAVTGKIDVRQEVMT